VDDRTLELVIKTAIENVIIVDRTNKERSRYPGQSDDLRSVGFE
jgi:hypothetical protein